METIKVHYLGLEVQKFTNVTMLDVIYHLGAKYGAIDYNEGIRKRGIVIINEDNTIKINPVIMDKIINKK